MPDHTTVTGFELCCYEACAEPARWSRIDGAPAYDHYTDLCDLHRDELTGDLFPLVVGECHPCLRESRAMVRAAGGSARFPCRQGRRTKMSEETWTEERVRNAYAEWKQLSNRAEDVVHAMQRARGQDEGYYEGLVLPDWYGTDWPGKQGYLGDSGSADGIHRFPLEWLWTAPGCVEEAKARHVEWLKTRESVIEEQKERAELKRLQAKFAPTASGEGGPADGT